MSEQNKSEQNKSELNKSELKKLYANSNHELPEFEKLNFAFEISDIETKYFLLRDIRRHMVEKLKNNIDILENIIHPTSSISAYHEYKFFDDEEKVKVYELYARMMGFVRDSNILDISVDEKKDADFINDVMNSWPDMKNELTHTFSKLRDCWTKDEISEAQVTSYFG